MPMTVLTCHFVGSGSSVVSSERRVLAPSETRSRADAPDRVGWLSQALAPRSGESTGGGGSRASSSLATSLA
jgi:hypothetical protein